jgi:putative glutamine amidotransferase
MVNADRPRIALVGDTRVASFGVWRDIRISAVWSSYLEALDRAGALPVVFPVIEAYADAPELVLDLVGGVLLTGGRDIDAGSYGAEPNPANDEGDPLRDRLELAVARAALERDMPVLAVCRGMQVLNVALGGGIEQHLDDPDSIHREVGSFVSHEVETVGGSKLAGIVGERATVRSHHHQGVEPLAGPLALAARSPDGLVEAAEAPDRSFCVAVLWHPEEDLDGGGADIYEAFVDAAADRRRALAPAGGPA